MRRRSQILVAVAAVLVAAAAVLAYRLQHDAPCGTAPELDPSAPAMSAVTHRCYGTPAVLRLERIPRPEPRPDQLLVKVRAASVNPLDWHYLRGTPYPLRLESGLGAPLDPRLGTDFAGVVESVGSAVTGFAPGDAVFGGADGAFAGYVTVRAAGSVAHQAPAADFGESAAVPIAGITALQALRDVGHVRAGTKVLVIGASGGVGTFAVQIAKHLGAEVTGVCSTRNVELVHALGAARVIDYTREDPLAAGAQYDVILDNVGNRSLAGLLSFRRILAPHGVFVLIGGGGPEGGNWLGPLTTSLWALLVRPFVSQDYAMMLAHLNAADLALLASMMQEGTLRPVIDRRYPLAETAAAMRYLEAGHARGKVIIDVAD